METITLEKSRLSSVEHPKDLVLKLAYFLSKREFGKVLPH